MLLTNMILRVIRLKQPISKPRPEVLMVVIMIVSPKAVRSVFDRSRSSSTTPQIKPRTTPNMPSRIWKKARPRKRDILFAGVPKR